MKVRKIAVIVGSLRKESINRKTAKALIDMAPSSYSMEIIDIGSLPFYNMDLENEAPPREWTDFREKMKNFDAFLFLTPEYNRSFPAVLKNALDVGSRPFGKSVWNGKPGAVVSVSRGAIGAFGANHHLRQSLVYLNVPVMAQPEAYIGNGEELFAPDGSLVKEDTRKFLRDFMDAYAKWVETILAGK
jgi:chromate reductase